MVEPRARFENILGLAGIEQLAIDEEAGVEDYGNKVPSIRLCARVFELIFAGPILVALLHESNTHLSSGSTYPALALNHYMFVYKVG